MNRELDKSGWKRRVPSLPGRHADRQYSWGWLDLRKGPVVLAHPDMGDRYFTFEIADMFSDNFAYVGKRSTGSAAGAYAILPPGWDGQLLEPAGTLKKAPSAA